MQLRIYILYFLKEISFRHNCYFDKDSIKKALLLGKITKKLMKYDVSGDSEHINYYKNR